MGFHAHAQENDLRVISPAGSTYESSGILLEWTVGEVAVQTLENPNNLLSQGFHQPTYNIVSIEPIPKEIGKLSVLPNPFTSFFEITMAFENSENGVIELYDMYGKQIFKTPFEGKSVVENYVTTKLTPGAYLLVISFSNHSFTQTIHLVKTL